MRVVCPEWGRSWGGGTARPNDTQQQHWHLRAGGHSRPRARRSEGNSFPSTPKSSLPEEGLWQQCCFPGTVSCPGWGVLEIFD